MNKFTFHTGFIPSVHFIGEVMISGAFGKINDGKITDEPTKAHLLKHAAAFKEFAGG